MARFTPWPSRTTRWDASAESRLGVGALSTRISRASNGLYKQMYNLVDDSRQPRTSVSKRRAYGQLDASLARPRRSSSLGSKSYQQPGTGRSLDPPETATAKCLGRAHAHWTDGRRVVREQSEKTSYPGRPKGTRHATAPIGQTSSTHASNRSATTLESAAIGAPSTTSAIQQEQSSSAAAAWESIEPSRQHRRRCQFELDFGRALGRPSFTLAINACRTQLVETATASAGSQA